MERTRFNEAMRGVIEAVGEGLQGVGSEGRRAQRLALEEHARTAARAFVGELGELGELELHLVAAYMEHVAAELGAMAARGDR